MILSKKNNWRKGRGRWLGMLWGWGVWASGVAGQTGAGGATRNDGAPKIVTFDASKTLAVAKPLGFPMGGKVPNGDDIEVNSLYITRNGTPWIPVMGEFQYSRYPETEWEDELLKIKAAGIQIVATYVFWIHHEEVEGEFDWSGRRDLRKFAELCRKHGLLVFARIGPYAHGEVRNGGLPDWVVKEGTIRRNEPEYLAHVRIFYQQIAVQLNGLLWKQGGPVVGIQLENEYFLRGPAAGAAHIAELKKMAREAGLDAPLFTVTGWGDADFPRKEVIPVFGVYPDAFWESSLEKLPANEAYTFALQRDSGGIAIDPNAAAKTKEERVSEYPHFLAEAGGGMEVAYHRRPVISADDVAAMVVTHLGAGANLYGYYMFHGGSNPDGKRTSLQESAAVDHVYDLPVVSYDFQAPLGEFGELRAAYRRVKVLHQFLHDFGEQLAPLVAIAPDVTLVNFADTTTPRAALRSNGKSGFLFFNNYLRDYPLQAQKDLQFRVKLRNEEVSVPRRPFTAESGTYFIWPVNIALRGVVLKYATVQPVCSLVVDGQTYYFFAARPGISAEFSFDPRTVSAIVKTPATVERSAREIFVSKISSRADVQISLRDRQGRVVNIVVLDAGQAENLWKEKLAGRERVLLSAADVFSKKGELVLRSTDEDKFSFQAFPRLENVTFSDGKEARITRNGIFTEYKIAVAPKEVGIKVETVRDAQPATAVKHGQYNAVAPLPEDFARAAAWKITVPGKALQGVSNLFLKIQYTGDVAHFSEGAHLLADDFFHGAAWDLGLKRFLRGDAAQSFALEILPLRKDAPIFIPREAWPKFERKNEIVELRKITAIPEYEVVVHSQGRVQ